ncbi:MAG: AzlD domain-containing protein [Anaerolineales bacterium]|nr:AzlD domain-containing protein [Anaerolineales bacterium]
MTPQNEFYLILGMMLVTFGTRYPIMALLSKRQLPDEFKLALEYVPPSVLVAIIVPEVLAPNGDLYLSISNSALAASLAAILISWRTKNLLATIIGGMSVYWLWGIIV